MTSRLFDMERYSKIVVLAPHCDDEVLGCGGYLLKSLESGCQLTIVYFTTDMAPTVDIRREEAVEAWRPYKNVQQFFWQYKDSWLCRYIAVAAERLSEVLQTCQPDAVFLPWPLDTHKDHQAVYDILTRTSLPASVTALYFYEVFYPLYANCTVDVSDVFFIKQGMLKKFASQRKLNLIPVITSLNQYRAAILRLRSIEYAESFYRTSSSCVDSLELVAKEYRKMQRWTDS